MTARWSEHDRARGSNEPLTERLARASELRPNDSFALIANCVAAWPRLRTNMRSQFHLDDVEMLIGLGVICQGRFHAGMRPSDWQHAYATCVRAAKPNLMHETAFTEYWYNSPRALFDHYGVHASHVTETALPSARQHLCIMVDRATNRIIACNTHTYCAVNSIPSRNNTYDMSVSSAYMERLCALEDMLTDVPPGWSYKQEIRRWSMTTDAIPCWEVRLAHTHDGLSPVAHTLELRPTQCPVGDYDYVCKTLTGMMRDAWTRILIHVNTITGMSREFAPHDPSQVLITCATSSYAEIQRMSGALSSALGINGGTVRQYCGVTPMTFTREILHRDMRKMMVADELRGIRMLLFIIHDIGVYAMNSEGVVRHLSQSWPEFSRTLVGIPDLCSRGMTIFDGTLVYNLDPNVQQNETFVGSHLIQLNGTPTARAPWTTNNFKLRDIIARLIMPALSVQNAVPFRICYKRFVPFVYYAMIHKRMHSMAHRRLIKYGPERLFELSGLYFVGGPLEHYVWTPPSGCTVDLLGEATAAGSDTLRLFADNNVEVGKMTLTSQQLVDVTRIQLDNEILSRVPNSAHTHRIIFECTIDFTLQRWVMTHASTTKTTATAAAAIFETIFRAAHPVRYAEICEIVNALIDADHSTRSPSP